MSVFHNLEPYHHDSYIRSPSVLSSSPTSVYSANTDGNINFYGSTMSSPMSCNMSPSSTISSSDSSNSNSSSSAYNFQHLQISSNTIEKHTYSISAQTNRPYLEITEQPIDKFRFRYKSEMHGTHGMLTSQNSKKKFPTVRLHNYNGEALIRCSLYQIEKPDQNMPFPHSHSLVVRCGNKDKKDPHEVIVSQLHGYQATFQGMGIIHTTRRYIEDELFEKLVAKAEFECGYALTEEQYDALREKAKKHSPDMNFNQVTLCFEAYKQINRQWVPLCDPVFSKPINNLKSALHGELKISRMSTVVGSATGNEDLFMFVEKVDKKNIKVKFYELDVNGKVVWEDEGKFTEADVHHQYAIALKTPAYRKPSIEESVNVYIQLYRPGDGAISESVEFRYKPCYNKLNDNRKRQRCSSFYDSDSPLPVEEKTHYYQPSNNYVPQNGHDLTIENEDIEKWMDELNNVEFNAEDIRSFLSSFEDYSEYDRLAKDSVGNASTTASDDGKKLNELNKEVKLVRQFLNIPLFKSGSVDERTYKIGRKLCAYIFERAIFNGDDTIIHICMKSDDNTLIEQMLDILHKFDLHELLNRRNFNKECCAHLASAMNKSNVLKRLVQFGANINSINVIDSIGNTPLHIAIECGHDDCVSALLAAATAHKKVDVDLSVLNDSGFTALHLAAIKNNLNVVKMLHRSAAAAQAKGSSMFDDVDGKHGMNALQLAIKSDAHDVAEYLIMNKCINPLKANKSGHTSLYLARVSNATHLLNLMRCHTISADDHSMENGDVHDDEDDDDASSKDSFESHETCKTNSSISTVKSVKSNVEIEKLAERKSEEWKFDDKCYMELSEIFNKDAKWKSVANMLGYQNFLGDWQNSRSPTKVLFMFAESLQVPKDTLIKIFEELGEERAAQCIQEWKHRCQYLHQ